MSFYPSASRPYLLVQPDGRLLFRIRIPQCLQPCLGKREYRRSLGRQSLSIAKGKALQLATVSLEIFQFVRMVLCARQGKQDTNLNADHEETGTMQGYAEDYAQYTSHLKDRPLAALSDEEIRAIADEWILAALQGANALRLQAERLRREALVKIDQQQGAPEQTETQSSQQSSPQVRQLTGEEREQANKDQSGLHKRIAERKREDLRRGNLQAARPAADRLLSLFGVTDFQDKESLPYLRLCQEMIKAGIAFNEAMSQVHDGDFDKYDSLLDTLTEKREKRRIKIDGAAAAAVAAAGLAAGMKAPGQGQRPRQGQRQAAAGTGKLKDVIPLYCREKSNDGSWKSHLSHRHKGKFELFQAIVDPGGRLDISQINAAVLREYKEVMLCLPTRVKGYGGLAIKEIISRAKEGKIPEQDRMTRGTVDTYFQQITAFLNWAALHEYHTNPAITRILEIKIERSEVLPYTKAEISKLFSPTIYLTAGITKAGKPALDSNGYASRFWLPLLCLFTGARIEEQAQLYLHDIGGVSQGGEFRPLFPSGEAIPPKQRGELTAAGILEQLRRNAETPCLFIREGNQDQHLKTKGSKRLIPLSSILTQELNFLGYALAMYQKDHKRLFPDLPKNHIRNKYADAVSKWYSRYRKSIGIKADEGTKAKKNFHSLRHTLGNWCSQNGLPVQHTAALMGHTQGNITHDTYATATSPAILHQEIVLRYDEYLRECLDLEGLKQSAWANMP